jgi:uncharacterized protein (DUF58 family)
MTLPLAGVAFFVPSIVGIWAVALVGISLLAALDLVLTKPAEIDVERELPARLFLGREHELQLRFHINKSSRTKSARVVATERIPLEWDGVGHVHAFNLVQGKAADITIKVRARKRGRYQLGALHVVQEAGLGLWRRVGLVDIDTEARVYPDYQPGAHALGGLRDFGDVGQRRTRQRGEGTDFDSLREYRDGDEPSRIDWKATARLGRVISRQFTVEKDHDVMIALDCGRLMGAEFQGVAKFDYALRAALALAEAGLRAGDRVGVLAFDDKVRCFVPPGKGAGQLGQILENLHDVTAESNETDFARGLTYLGVHHRKRSLVVLLTDFVDQFTAGPMMVGLASVSTRHACLFVSVEDPTLEEQLLEAPRDTVALAGHAVAHSMRRSRAEVLQRIRRTGATVLDLQPDKLTGPVINAYLRLKDSGSI